MQSDPVEFLSWLVNTLHHELTGGKRKRRSGAWGCRQGAEPVLLHPASGWAARAAGLAPSPAAYPTPAAPHRAVITDCLQGELEVVTEAGTGKAKDSAVDVTDHVPFLMLGALRLLHLLCLLRRAAPRWRVQRARLRSAAAASPAGQLCCHHQSARPCLPLHTGLDLPAAPLFKDALEKVIIPQVPGGGGVGGRVSPAGQGPSRLGPLDLL